MKSFTQIKEACDLIDAALEGRIPGIKLNKKSQGMFRAMGTALFWVALEPKTPLQQHAVETMDGFLRDARILLDHKSGASSHPE